MVTLVVGIIILGGDIGDFANLPSVMLTVVPTIGALFASFPLGQMAKIGKHFSVLLGRQKFDPMVYVNTMSELAEKARSQGLLSLEVEAESMEDKFIKGATLMVADATDPETVEMRLNGILDAMALRHSQAWAIYDKGASYAPAFGMCATVISLVNMLMNLNFADAGGVSSLGTNMSAALITTLYGSILANVFFFPIAAKLRVRHQAEVDCKRIVIEGILAIQQGINPKVVKEMLIERLDPKYASLAAEE